MNSQPTESFAWQNINACTRKGLQCTSKRLSPIVSQLDKYLKFKYVRGGGGYKNDCTLHKITPKCHKFRHLSSCGTMAEARAFGSISHGAVLAAWIVGFEPLQRRVQNMSNDEIRGTYTYMFTVTPQFFFGIFFLYLKQFEEGIYIRGVLREKHSLKVSRYR